MENEQANWPNQVNSCSGTTAKQIFNGPTKKKINWIDGYVDRLNVYCFNRWHNHHTRTIGISTDTTSAWVFNSEPLNYQLNRKKLNMTPTVAIATAFWTAPTSAPKEGNSYHTNRLYTIHSMENWMSSLAPVNWSGTDCIRVNNSAVWDQQQHQSHTPTLFKGGKWTTKGGYVHINQMKCWWTGERDCSQGCLWLRIKCNSWCARI